MNAGPQRTSRLALAVSLLSVCFLDYGDYRDAFHAAPDTWMDIARGTAAAPQQYRVGVVRAALWISRHSPLHLQHAFAVLDTVSALIAGMVLLRVLERSAVFRRAALPLQWFGAACFVGLVTFYLLWLATPQRPETLPAAMCVALMLRLWQPPPPSRMSGSQMSGARQYGVWLPSVLAVALLGLSAVLGLVRADVACVLNLGVFAATLTPLGRKLSLPRVAAAYISLAGVAVAGGLQLYLMRVAYPQAAYGRVKMWQLRPNLIHATRWPGFVLFMIPVAWTAWQAWRRRFAEDAASVALLLGAGMYVCAWAAIGKVDEVRIFVPWALALTPLTMEMAMLRAREKAGGSAAGESVAGGAGRSAV